MISCFHRSVAICALVVLVLPGLLGVVHLSEHDHIGIESEFVASAHGTAKQTAVAVEACVRDGATHIEAAQLATSEPCGACILQTRMRSDLRNQQPGSESMVTFARVSSENVGHPDSTVARLYGSRAPPLA